MAVSWRVADSLDVLREQLNAHAPRRSRASDGALGDTAHANRASDHNPWLVIDGRHYVSARDFTHDPGGGLDCARLAAVLARARDGRVKYLIWDRQIMAGAGGPQPWTWRRYSGPNPHHRHLHLSVVADRHCLNRAPWALLGLVGPAPAGEHDLRPDPRHQQPRGPTPEDDMSWTREQGAPPVPDYYKGSRALVEPLPDPLQALAHAAAHAANARDAARRAADTAARIESKLDQLDQRIAALTKESS